MAGASRLGSGHAHSRIRCARERPCRSKMHAIRSGGSSPTSTREVRQPIPNVFPSSSANARAANGRVSARSASRRD